jgi:hypothetical protein
MSDLFAPVISAHALEHRLDLIVDCRPQAGIASLEAFDCDHLLCDLFGSQGFCRCITAKPR